MRFKRIFVEDGARNYPLASAILQKLPELERQTIANFQELDNLEFKEGKRSLALMVKKGRAVKDFPPASRPLRAPRMGQETGPGQKSARPCLPAGRKELYIFAAQSCPYDCHYCYLQAYSQCPAPIIFVNTSDILKAVEEAIWKFRHQRPYFHAGELSDALVFDPLTDFSKSLIDLFNDYPQAALELRTKSTEVENLLSTPHKGNIIPSWTFSPQEVVRLYETGTPSLELRMNAAMRCQEAGYSIGLRFDPIIRISNWQKAYKEMMEAIFSELEPERIESASLGCFRYTRALERTIRLRFPEDLLLLDEFVLADDGKFRYFKPLRAQMYRYIIGLLRERAPKLSISLCMETPEVRKRLARELGVS